MSNFIYVMSDEHNPFVSSIYGHPSVHTPNMARLAERGTVFENTYCPSPLCLPCRSAFFAGRRVHEIQTYNNCNTGLRKGFPSFGRLLTDQGVHTTFIGKSDGYDRVANFGFSEIIEAQDRDSPDCHIRREPLEIRPDAASRARHYGPHEAPFETDLKRTDAAIRWLRETAPQIDSPWVLCVNLNKPHFPHYVTPDLWSMYDGCDDLPRYGAEQESAQHQHATDLRRYFATDQFTEEDIRGLRRGYLGCVTFIDTQLGRLIDALDESGLSDSTNIAYTSDHGDMLGMFGMWWKCSLYEHSVRVPLIVAGPDFSAGVWCETPVSSLDLQASIFYATGAKRPDDLTGEPLQEIPHIDSQRIVFSEYHGHGARASAYMVRRGEWKFIYYVGAPNQLFNLASDPNELDNRIESETEIARELESELRCVCDPENENERASAFIEMQRTAALEGFARGGCCE